MSGAFPQRYGQMMRHDSRLAYAVGAVAARGNDHQLGVFLDKARGGSTLEKVLVVEHIEQEGDVGLDATDARLHQGANNAAGGAFKVLRRARELRGQGHNRIRFGIESSAGTQGLRDGRCWLFTSRLAPSSTSSRNKEAHEHRGEVCRHRDECQSRRQDARRRYGLESEGCFLEELNI